MSLTPKQRRFVGEYLKDLNATQAAIRAGYSARTANRIASENLSKPDIQAEIQKHAAKHLEKLDISAERILTEVARLAFSNMADYITVENGEPRIDLSRVQRDQTAAIVSMHITKDGVRLRLADKRGALELLGKYQKLFTERYEIADPPMDFTKLSDSEFEEFERLAEKCGVSSSVTPRPGRVQ